MPIVDSPNFSLNDVRVEMGEANPFSLNDAFVAANPAGFDSNYAATGERLSEFRNYTHNTDTTPPTVPSLNALLSWTAIDFSLSWTTSTDSGSGLSHYEVQRKINTGTWTDYGSDIPAGTTSIIINTTGYVDGNIYYWRVRAVDNNDNASAWSNERSIGFDDSPPSTPPTPNPSSFQGDIHVQWSQGTDSHSGIFSNTMYKKVNSGSWDAGRLLIGTSGQEIYYSQAFNNTYWFKVESENGAKLSTMSAEASIFHQDFCLVKGTKILMADNSTKLIEELDVAENLASVKLNNLPNSNKITDILGWEATELESHLLPAIIVKYGNKFVNEVIDLNDGLLTATDTHIQLIERKGVWKFVRFRDIEIGDKLLNNKNEKISINKISKLEGKFEIYPLTLDSPHTYFANGILTHNFK